jgi:hypothetical protein
MFIRVSTWAGTGAPIHLRTSKQIGALSSFATNSTSALEGSSTILAPTELIAPATRTAGRLELHGGRPDNSERYIVIPMDAARRLCSLQNWAGGGIVGEEFIEVLGDCFRASTLPRKRLMLRDKAGRIFISHFQ